jgi:hypothetical protein
VKSKKTTHKGPKQTRGGIVKALRRSPLVGADLSRDRPAAPDRKIDLPETGLSMREWLQRTNQAKPIPSKETAAQMIRHLRDGR